MREKGSRGARAQRARVYLSMDDPVKAGKECARILAEADHLIELGPGAGADGGRVICQGSVAEVAADPASRVGGFLTGEKDVLSRPRTGAEEMFDLGTISMETSALHTVRPLHVEVPRGRLVVVTGVSGSGKTTLVLETLVPALSAAAACVSMLGALAACAAHFLGEGII